MIVVDISEIFHLGNQRLQKKKKSQISINASFIYGGLRENIFLLPFWEKRGFGAKTPPKISSVNLIKAFNTNISPI
jgi:hypothetical protein